MRSQIKLGRIFGIEIGLHYSWFFIALLIVFSLFQQFHAANQDWGDGAIILTALDRHRSPVLRLSAASRVVAFALCEIARAPGSRDHSVRTGRSVAD